MRIRNVPLNALGPYGRSRGYAGFAFGTASQYQPNKDCPVGGSWENWCNCVFTPGSELNTRCLSKPIGPALFAAPWTEVGAGARGLPKPDSLAATLTSAGMSIISGVLPGGIIQAPPPPPPAVGVQSSGSTTVTVTSTPTAQTAAEESSIFGVPKTIAFVGAGVLVLGVVGLALSGRR